MTHFPITESDVLSTASIVSISVAVTRWVMADVINTVSEVRKQWTRVKHEREHQLLMAQSKRK